MDDTHWRALLRAKSYRVTRQRLAVLEVLGRTRRPVRAQEILYHLREKSFDQATIYRTLLTLKNSGIVKQIDFQHGAAYYELADRREHHHAICTRCERVEDVADCCVEGMDSAALRQSGFAEITQHALEFFGVCKGCKQRYGANV